MRRRWRDRLTLLSLIVCVASAALVGRSFVREDAALIRLGQNVLLGESTFEGKLMLWQLPAASVYVTEYYGSNSAATARHTWETVWARMTGSRWLGTGWGTNYGVEFVVLPLWLVPIVTAIPPLRWWRKRRKEGGRGFAVNVATAGDDRPMDG